MSHTQKIRQDIADNIPKQESLRRAMLTGMLLDSHPKGEAVSVLFSSEAACTTVQKLARILFGASAEASERVIAGRKSYTLSFHSHKLADTIEKRKRGLGECEISLEEVQYILRGAFLAVGRINDPMAEAHMEFAFSDEDVARAFCDFFDQNSLPSPGCSARRNKYVVYFKSNDKICDVLSAMKVESILFEYINTGIFKGIGNSEHRATNCISGNINRAVVAGSRHRAACEYLLGIDDGAMLDSGMRTTALLRLNNPTMSLTELAELHVPPLTKSGINHRLKKIIELAEKLGFKETVN
ncbi:MAG: DNA-binding protein WhiA [Clostridia bacterium]|nr:DNA-binding protein WhiA [Clostridia bacterium]